MAHPLKRRDEELAALRAVLGEAERYLAELDDAPVLQSPDSGLGGALPEDGVGAITAIEELVAGAASATRSSGPRFFHFVTGGTTPAALSADWLSSLFDQNAFSQASSPLGVQAEEVAVRWLLDLFELPSSWGGVLTTGATMANFVGLACGRRWWAEHHGVDVDEQGLGELPTVPVLSTWRIHASARKALAMLGLGRSRVRIVDPGDLGRELAASGPAIVIGNAGEVNDGSFDPLAEMAELAERHAAWLHVDAAFGLFARLTPRTSAFAEGVQRADSVISDGHKWLNVPYDCGFAFVRDPELLRKPFRLTGPYLPSDELSGPEASRRARGLAVWATLRAYGRNGYRELVERHLDLAQRLGRRIEEEPELELLAPVVLNIACFRHRPRGMPETEVDAHNEALGADVLADGRVFVGTTHYEGKVAFRPAIANWRTSDRDIDFLVDVLLELGERRAARPTAV